MLGASQAESRFLTVAIGELWVASVYAPYGPTIARRVEWLNRLRDHVENAGYAGRKSLFCGDFNVKCEVEARAGRAARRTKRAPWTRC